MRERRDRERDRDRDRERDRDRDRDRERERNRERDRERERERERERYRSKSKSPARSSRNRSKSKKKKSKKSKKYYRHSRSSSRSTSRSSQSSRSSSRSRQSKGRDHDVSKPKSRPVSQRTTRAPSADTSSRQAATSTVPPTVAPPAIKAIDLLDAKVQKALETIDEDAFKPSAFFSTRDREAPEKEKVIIDLNKETVTVSKPVEAPAPPIEDEIFHPNFLGDAELKAEKWLRKLYNYRQKYMQQ